jgi:hypothetical protein
MAWVIQHEMDFEPTYVVPFGLADRGEQDDDESVVLGANIPAELRLHLAKVIVDFLNKEAQKEV